MVTEGGTESETEFVTLNALTFGMVLNEGQEIKACMVRLAHVSKQRDFFFKVQSMKVGLLYGLISTN